MASKIYIGGKISGIENEAPKLFAKAEKELQAFVRYYNTPLFSPLERGFWDYR